MLAISAINFSALNYLFFNMVVCIISIIEWLVISLIQKNKDQTIPFAGYLAVGLIFLRLYLLFNPNTNCFSDHFLLTKIYGIY